MPPKEFFVYIITNISNTVLYVGVTNNLIRRINEHKNKLADGFSKQYNLDKLVFFEIYSDAESAILREKQLKGGSRQKKLNLIKKDNPKFRDLYSEII